MSLKIALVMMQKNEGHLLEAWNTYVRNLVDPGSLFIFDNGSNDAHTLNSRSWRSQIRARVTRSG